MSRQSSKEIKDLESQIDNLPEQDKFSVRAALQSITQAMNNMPPVASGLLIEYLFAVIKDVKENKSQS